MKAELKAGEPNCQHSYTRQDKVTLQILVRVCTKCGQEEIMCDNELIDAALAKKLLKR